MAAMPTSTASEASFRTIESRFLARFAAAMDCETKTSTNPPFVYWLDPRGRLHHVQLGIYSQPSPEHPAEPLVVRIHLDHYQLDDERALLRRAGWQGRLFTGKGGPGFELSVLPEEAIDFAPWVSEFARLRQGGDPHAVAPPPHPCKFWGGWRPGCNYAWSTAAHEAYERAQSTKFPTSRHRSGGSTTSRTRKRPATTNCALSWPSSGPSGQTASARCERAAVTTVIQEGASVPSCFECRVGVEVGRERRARLQAEAEAAGAGAKLEVIRNAVARHRHMRWRDDEVGDEVDLMLYDAVGVGPDEACHELKTFADAAVAALPFLRDLATGDHGHWRAREVVERAGGRDRLLQATDGLAATVRLGRRGGGRGAGGS